MIISKEAASKELQIFIGGLQGSLGKPGDELGPLSIPSSPLSSLAAGLEHKHLLAAEGDMAQRQGHAAAGLAKERLPLLVL